MGLSRDQKVATVLDGVQWLTVWERIEVLFALLNIKKRATVPYDASVRWEDDGYTAYTRYHYRPISLWTGK